MVTGLVPLQGRAVDCTGLHVLLDGRFYQDVVDAQRAVSLNGKMKSNDQLFLKTDRSNAFGRLPGLHLSLSSGLSPN